jgi:hypothetical protein
MGGEKGKFNYETRECRERGRDCTTKSTKGRRRGGEFHHEGHEEHEEGRGTLKGKIRDVPH